MDNLKAPKSALQTMLIYYYQTLLKSGVKDPRQVIATELPKMINLSKEQSEYIYEHIDDNTLTTKEIIDSLIAILLPHTKDNITLNKKDATLMINNLKILKDNIRE